MFGGLSLLLLLLKMGLVCVCVCSESGARSFPEGDLVSGVELGRLCVSVWVSAACGAVCVWVGVCVWEYVNKHDAWV